MPGHRAQVRVHTLLLERHDELGRSARLDQRRLLAVDLEVMQNMADVVEDECHRAGLPERLAREAEEELAALDLDRGRALGARRLSWAAGRGSAPGGR